MQKHSTLEVLGCSGSIGIPGQGTTSFLIDHDILIDAGTGLCQLDLARLEQIEHVVVTHCHLDHICGLPLLIDAVGVVRRTPLRVYATAPTIRALQKYIFNEEIWPDFSKIPSATQPVLEYVEIKPEQVLIFGQRNIQLVEVNHSVPAVGVFLFTPTGGWCFSGDTHQTDRLFGLINQSKKVDYFFIESAFSDKEKWLADLAKHLCPSLVLQELEKLNVPCEVWVTHLKPRDCAQIKQELQQHAASQPLRVLSAGMIFNV